LLLKNKKLNSKNLPTKPASGGTPDIDNKTKTTVIEVKLTLKKTLIWLSALILFISYRKSKQKNR
jgi:hypothetical protein